MKSGLASRHHVPRVAVRRFRACQRTRAGLLQPLGKGRARAAAQREQVGPTVEQVTQVIALMPAKGAIQRLDRAFIAFAPLTGARDNAIAS